MTANPSTNEFDVIVIGSGMGGMTTATALSRLDHKVLLLEQAQVIGGLTHTFTREGFSWDVGLHYCGIFGHDQFAGRILDWLSGGAIEFHSLGTVYDTLHFPEGFDISVGRPAEAYKMELKDRFPDNVAEIDAYFEALLSAEEAAYMVGAERAIPEPFRSTHRWWNKKKIQRWASRTTGEVIDELISNPKLATVLSAQWGTYGGKPKEASFAFHGMVMGHYLDGAAYPVGGAGAIAKGLVPVIEAAGGSARAGTPVSEILLDDGKAVGVRTQSGEEFNAPIIVTCCRRTFANIPGLRRLPRSNHRSVTSIFIWALRETSPNTGQRVRTTGFLIAGTPMIPPGRGETVSHFQWRLCRFLLLRILRMILVRRTSTPPM